MLEGIQLEEINVSLYFQTQQSAHVVFRRALMQTLREDEGLQ